jgi:hypothetical protein
MVTAMCVNFMQTAHNYGTRTVANWLNGILVYAQQSDAKYCVSVSFFFL